MSTSYIDEGIIRRIIILHRTNWVDKTSLTAVNAVKSRCHLKLTSPLNNFSIYIHFGFHKPTTPLLEDPKRFVGDETRKVLEELGMSSSAETWTSGKVSLDEYSLVNRRSRKWRNEV
ncbi:hypothetical protein EVAR_91793_1 [Eumeta japonica]|uniref:Uncharacterized protein n=1 Tax=Eumeta variegata TaxID=151549 RepID=A0A4C1T4V1_EUMVA|nr:hypothetical protein EVAR_91793_1 [Eumeta japonica]